MFGFGLFKRIPIIVGVFLPVDHGVLDIASNLPVCLNGGFPGNKSDRFIILIIPAGKGIACPGGLLNLRKLQRFAINDKLRGNVAAAVGIKGDPIAAFHHGIQFARAFGKLNATAQRVAVQLFAPALHGLVGIQSQANLCLCRRDILWFHGIVFSALHGVHHGFAFGVHKVHIAAGCLELGLHAHGLAAGNGGGHTIGELCFAVKPALKNIAVFLGRSGNFQRIAFGNSLGPIFLLYIIHIELIGIHLEIGFDAGGLGSAAKQIADRIFQSVPFRSAVFLRGFLGRFSFGLHGLAVSLCRLAVSLCGLAVSLCGLAVSLCGLAVSLCGFAVSLCGFAVSLCGFAVSFCGLAISLCGFAVSLCGFAGSLAFGLFRLCGGLVCGFLRFRCCFGQCFRLLFLYKFSYSFTARCRRLVFRIGKRTRRKQRKCHGKAKCHGNDSFFHRFSSFSLIFFSTLAGG